MAIKAQKDEQATLQQINDWLIQNFLFFRGEYIGWKNSVRHNLSLNDCFVKVTLFDLIRKIMPHNLCIKFSTITLSPTWNQTDFEVHFSFFWAVTGNRQYANISVSFIFYVFAIKTI